MDRVVAGLLALLALAGPARSDIAAWYTPLGPQVMMQDPISGDLWHSSCHSNRTPIFPLEKPNVFPLKYEPRNGTALAGAGWYDKSKTKVRFLS